MTAVTGAVLFRYESKGSGFHANERPNDEPFVVQKACTRRKV